MGILDGWKSKKLLKEGCKAQEQKNLEVAYALYEQAASLGNADAMLAIGRLYMQHGFRPIKKNNLMSLLAQGMPIMPWSLEEKLIPDTLTALSWYRKAADKGHVQGLRFAGVMLCEGEYCPQDIDQGLQYLDKAAAKGDTPSRLMRFLHSKPVRKNIPDAQYDRWLTAFQKAADKTAVNMYELYSWLKSGSDAQLARMGYMLVTAKNIGKEGYRQFKYLYAQSGLPLIPACFKRANWQSFVRIDLNALAKKDALIALSIDFGAEHVQLQCHRLQKCGTAVYRSPSFGWLQEEKGAVLLRIAPDAILTDDCLNAAIQQFMLIPEEYEPDNAAFFIENGEKEYSVEIAAITGKQVDILLRYTIGGSDSVHGYFTPELISMQIE